MAAHCNCKAGLGETCSTSLILHLGYRTIEGVEYRYLSTSILDVTYITNNFWICPSSQNFISEGISKKQLDGRIYQCSQNFESSSIPSPKRSTKKPVERKSDAEWESFFNTIKDDKPACLSVHRDYNQPYKPIVYEPKYPLILSELYIEESVGSSFTGLIKQC